MGRLRYILVIILLAACSSAAAARSPLLRYGLEWGFTPTLLASYHFNYISDEGYRVNDQGGGGYFAANGSILAHFGVNVTETFSLSLLSGAVGISEGNRVFPAMLRVSAYPKGVSSDGIFIFADGGVGFHADNPNTPTKKNAVLASLGGGYRFALSRSISFDLLASLRGAYDHASILNPDGPGYIPEQNIRRNNAGYIALNISAALTF